MQMVWENGWIIKWIISMNKLCKLSSFRLNSLKEEKNLKEE